EVGILRLAGVGLRGPDRLGRLGGLGGRLKLGHLGRRELAQGGGLRRVPQQERARDQHGEAQRDDDGLFEGGPGVPPLVGGHFIPRASAFPSGESPAASYESQSRRDDFIRGLSPRYAA